MENRFGLKDLVVVVLLLAVLLMVFLAMVMFNRQFDKIQTISDELNEQKSVQARVEKNIADIQRQIEEGGGTTDSAALLEAIRRMQAQDSSRESDIPLTVKAEPDPFARIKAAHDHADYAQGDWLVDAFAAKVAKITPLVSGDVYGSLIQARILESLATRDPQTLEFQPLLARSWKINNNVEAWQAYVDMRREASLTEAEIRQEPFFNSEDKPSEEEARTYIAERMAEGRREEEIINEADCPPAIEIIFQIRKGILFSDGEPMTADDFAFTWEWIQNPEVDAPRARAYFARHIKSVEATGEHELTVQLKRPYFEYFGLASGFEAMPRHFYEKFTPEEFNSRPGLLMGTGPYRLDNPENWTPEKPLILYRNERYWGPTPSFDRLVYKVIMNEVARLTDFKNGDIDRFSAQPHQYVELVKDPEILAKADAFNYDRINAGYFYVAWAQDRLGKPTPFADKRVRQAMTMLIDRQRMVDDIVKGYGQVATGPFNPLGDQDDETIEPWPYDPQRAKALLKEAGYEDRDDDGVIEGPDGKPLRFELIYPSPGERWAKIGLLIKDGLAKAGVVCDARGLEWSVFSETLRSNDFDAIALGWSAGTETDIHQMFHSDNIGKGRDNFMYYRNPKLDQIIDQARQTLDDEKRMALWNQAHRILHEDQPYTFLYTGQSLILIDKRIRNVERTRLGLNEIYEWYVPKTMQKY